MNLLQSPNGNLTNLSTTPRMAKAPGALRTSYELQGSTLRTRWRDFVSLDDEQFRGPFAYGDFDCDGDEDFFVAPHDITASIFNDGRPAKTTPVRVYAMTVTVSSHRRQRDSSQVRSRNLCTREGPAGRLQRRRQPDIFIADHGADLPPHPGAPPVLLLSSENGLRSVGGLEHVVGFHHGAASGDIDHDGDLGIFLTDSPDQPKFLINDGRGNFVRDMSAVPAELHNGYTTEFIDVDDDDAPDLLVAGHEHEHQPTVIYWGDRSGTYDASRKTTLPAVPGRGIVVDIDAEDLDGDGNRDIVLSRTSSEPPRYVGHYLQIIAGNGARRFADETTQRIADAARPTARWLEWIRLEDVNGDGFRISGLTTRPTGGLTWLNDGSGHFAKPDPAGLAPIDWSEFRARFVGRRMNSTSFSISFLPHWRFIDAMFDARAIAVIQKTPRHPRRHPGRAVYLAKHTPPPSELMRPPSNRPVTERRPRA